MKFLRVSTENGHWPKLLKDWEQQCSDFRENFFDYAVASLSTLRPLAEQAQTASTGVFALLSPESRYLGACQLNAAYLPGYTDKVLRVRHIVHAPHFDFDDNVTLDDYTSFLSDLFIGVFEASDTEMPAAHMKFHFQSPAERAFFSVYQKALKSHSVVAKVELNGSWLYITK